MTPSPICPASPDNGPAPDSPTPGAPPHYARLLHDSGLPRHEARRLMSLVTGHPATWLIAHADDPAPTEVAARFMALAARRAAGEPLAYLTGEQEFFGRRFGVSPAVLIPRDDTGTLVEAALARLPAAEAPSPAHVTGATGPAAALRRRTDGVARRSHTTTADADGRTGMTAWPRPAAGHALRGQHEGEPSGHAAPPCRVLDLGTGSGIVAITLALEAPGIEMHAVERSAEALAVARQNARQLGAQIHWHEGSWWAALPSVPSCSPSPAHASCAPSSPTLPPHGFDLIVSNPPYVAAADPHLRQGDLHFEPPGALAAGPDGLDDLRIIIDGAADWLKPGGWLLLEHGHDQGAAVRALLSQAGFAEVFTQKDLAGHDRVGGGRRPQAQATALSRPRRASSPSTMPTAAKGSHSSE